MSMFSHYPTTPLHDASRPRHSGRARATALAVVAPISLVLASFGVAGAGAQTTRPAITSALHQVVAPAVASPRTNQFCTFGENTVKANASAGVLATETPKTIASAYSRI